MKTQKGITLLVLAITIIVMLILVGISVSIALKGGLFNTAKKTTDETQLTAEKQILLTEIIATIKTNGQVDFIKLDKNLAQEGIFTGTNGIYTSKTGNKFIVDEMGNIDLLYKTSIEGLSETVQLIPYEKIEEETSLVIKAGVDAGKIKAVLKEEVKNEEGEITQILIAVLPVGFEISVKEGENTISGGLVITDGTNEFVWIPYLENNTYVEDDLGPLLGTNPTSEYVFDSQDELDFYYGKKEDEITSYYNYSDFTYDEDRIKMEESINKYKGFYIGRYETTIDNGVIGVQKGKTVLTSYTKVRTGTNGTINKPYYYRWWGLYKAQKDMYADNNVVFSSMITSKQWDIIMEYIGYNEASKRRRQADTYTTKPDLSGSAYATDNTQYDVSKNIYDLVGNVVERTLTVSDSEKRIYRGAYYAHIGGANSKGYQRPSWENNYFGSRVVLCIK